MAMRRLKSEYKVMFKSDAADISAIEISEQNNLLRVVLQRRGSHDHNIESVIYIPLSRIECVVGIEVSVDGTIVLMASEREKEIITLAKEKIDELFRGARE